MYADALTQALTSVPASPPATSAGKQNAGCAQRTLLHDLTNVAAGVQVLIDLLEESTSVEAQSEYLRLLQSSMQRLHSRIDNEKRLLDQGSGEFRGGVQISVRAATTAYLGTRSA